MRPYNVAKIRVWELAKEFGIDSKELLRVLNAQGEFVRSASSTLEGPVVAKVRQLFDRPSRSGGREPSVVVPNPIEADLTLEASSQPRIGAGWRAGAVPIPQTPALLAGIEGVSRRFPIFRQHLEELRSLGSQIVFAGMCRQADFKNCAIALVRFSGAIEAGFGFTREVMLFYGPHNDLQARTFEAAVRELSNPHRSVTPDTFFMWAPDLRLRIKLNDWSTPSRLAIPMLVDPEDQLGFITLLRDYIYDRDLFYVTTPVHGASFFGRRTLLQSLRDDVFNQRVTGLFGLRKSGKTSILVQLAEDLKQDGVVTVLMDLEPFPSPPEDPTDDILADLRRRLIVELKGRHLRTQELSELNQRPSILELKNALQELLKRLEHDGHRVLLFLDEIEYLTPSDRIDIAEGDMPRVAQMLAAFRSLVQETSNFTFILSGLTSAIVEGGRLYGRPNPLFSWAKSVYVSPLTREEADDLAATVGAKMGIQIQTGALEALHEASGGHAFLYRNLSSAVVRRLPRDDFQRVMTQSAVLTELAEWTSRIRGNIEEMIQYVKRYYATEAVMLELLMDDPSGFLELLPTESRAVRRLLDLGLIHQVDGQFETSVVLELL